MSLADDMNAYTGTDVWADVVQDHPEYDADATKKIRRVEVGGRFIADTDGQVFRWNPTHQAWLYAGHVTGFRTW